MTWQMSGCDQRAWWAPQTVAALGEPMAQWLEGTLESWPGYEPGYGPDDETLPLVPVLTALCRAGYVTTCSQPGLAGPGADGAWWQQRAAVEGYLTDRALYRRIREVAARTGLHVVADDPSAGRSGRPLPATTRDGETTTVFGHRPGRRDLRIQWRGISPAAYRDLRRAIHLTLIAPDYGHTGNRLLAELGGTA